jgi:putative addiction module CopG family antidote
VVKSKNLHGFGMELTLRPELQRLIEERLKSGRYATAEEVVAAALLTLDQQESVGDFEPDEMDSLLIEGEQSIADEGLLDGDKAFQERQQRRAQKRLK